MSEEIVAIRDIESVVESEFYFQPGGTTLTICVLTTVAGFHVTGESACVSPSNFDKKEGEGLSRKDAIRKLWELEGYLLTNKLHEESKNV